MWMMWVVPGEVRLGPCARVIGFESGFNSVGPPAGQTFRGNEDLSVSGKPGGPVRPLAKSLISLKMLLAGSVVRRSHLRCNIGMIVYCTPASEYENTI